MPAKGRAIFGPHASYAMTTWLYLRALGLIALVAFISMWWQADGLIMSEGLLPSEQTLKRLSARAMERDWGLWTQFQFAPTIFWFGASDFILSIGLMVGTLASLFIVLNIFTGPAIVVAWVLYLSFVSVSQIFFNYQWDALLIECLFMALFVAPWSSTPGPWRWFEQSHSPSYLAITLQRFILFKLIFSSGLVKLWSEDAPWLNLSALQYHYWTQPLPNLLGYWLHKLPESVHQASCAIMFVIELGTICLIFFGPRLRMVALLTQVFLQLAILATGNFGFFNLLTLALCFTIADDRLLPAWVLNRSGNPQHYPSLSTGRVRVEVPHLMRRICLSMLISMHIGTMLKQAPYTIPAVEPLLDAATSLRPLRSLNSYGLFANMTEERPEIIVEGSVDGIQWKPYSFRWKPDQLNEPPSWATPHMPRLDWQLWFAALGGNCQSSPWYFRFLEHLLSNSQPVLNLMNENPFKSEPPRYIQSTLYQYQFTNSASLEATDNYWQRSEPQTFCPIVELVDGELRSVY